MNSVDVYSGDTDVNTALDGTIYSHDVIQKYDDGKKERIHITLKNQNLPKLLVFLRAEEWNKDPIRTPRILNLKAEDGMHRYRLIGVVDDDPAIGHHVEAQIEIVQEYYRANDLRNPRVERIHFNESSTLRQMAFYEEEK